MSLMSIAEIANFLDEHHQTESIAETFIQLATHPNSERWQTACIAVELMDGGSCACVINELGSPNLPDNSLTKDDGWALIENILCDAEHEALGRHLTEYWPDNEAYALAKIKALATAALKFRWSRAESVIALTPVNAAVHELWPTACFVAVVAQGFDLKSLSVITRQSDQYEVAAAIAHCPLRNAPIRTIPQARGISP